MKILYLIIFVTLLFVSLCFSQNYSLNFNGSTYVSVPHSSSLDLGDQFTIECWFTVQGSHINDHIGIISKTEASHQTASGFKLGLLEPFTVTYPTEANFTLYNYPQSSGVTTLFNPILNSWYHLAVTYDGSIMRLFLNGSLIKESAVSASILNNTLPLTIGGQNGNFWNRNLNGKIDEVRISSNIRYTSNFNPATNFNNDVYTKALYHFNEGSGTLVTDESGNGNNGTIYGATWSTDVPPPQSITNYSLKLNWNHAITADRLEVPFSPSINSYNDTKKLTISLWYKPIGEHTGWNWYLRKSIGGCQDDFAFGHSTHQPGDYSYLVFGNARSCTGDQYLEVFQTGIQIGQWNHIEVNYDVLIGRAQIFINGELKAETNSFSGITANQIVTYILMGMNGLVDDLHFSNSIRHTQNFTPALEETSDQSSIFLFKMNEGSGNILTDASTNNNNANIIDPLYVEGWSTDVPQPLSILTTIWQAVITVRDNGGLESSNTLTFGQDSSATDSLDIDLGEYELPPVPPTGVFDARFNLPLISSIGSLKDYRNASDTSIVWTMTFQPSASGYPITFDWSGGELPQSGSFFLKDYFGLVNVNMRTQNSYTLTNPAITSLKIEFSRTNTREVNVLQGWNILSVPLNTLDMTANTLFPGATTYFFGYNNGYLIVDTLQNGKGYWAKYNTEQTFQVEGNLVDPLNVIVNSDWNIIGPFDYNVPVSDITSTPPNIVATYYFGYNNGYQISDTLKVGKGYWVRTNSSGTLHLNNLLNTPISNNSNQMALVEANFTITDGAGGTTLLKAGIDSLGTDGLDPLLGEYEVPPLPPAGVFDARFNLPSSIISTVTDIRQGNINGGFNREHQIQYQVGTGTAIIINYDFGAYTPEQVKGRLQDIVTGTLIDTMISGSGSYSVPNPSVFNKLKLTMIYGNSIPVELTSFTALNNDNEVELRWTTATETNNSGFSIERKNKNEKNWNAISFIDGRGTTTEVTNYSYTDKNLSAGSYNYRLKQIDFDGSYKYSNTVEVEVNTPKKFALKQNYPNPFNPSTTISFEIPKQSNVLIKVYDVLGNEITTLVNEEKPAGSYQVIFDASALSNGVYFYRLQAGSFVETKKMILMK
ncbi:MAG: LamG-like jellyroll fold domain-containing protein [Ignavibacteriota bacterium]